MLDKKVKQKLEESGWYEGRKINIKSYVEILENCGFEVFDSAKQFIEEFGDLDIKVESKVSSTSIVIFNTYVKRILEVFNEYNDKDIIRNKYFDLSKNTDEKIVPIDIVYYTAKYSSEVLKYIQSLPEYDEKIFKKITGDIDD